MNSPQFNVEQFVDNTSLSTAFSQVLSSAREMGANRVFFNPGLVNPSAILFTYNSNLIVTVNAQAPFKSLFLTGAYASANGIVNGQSSSIYQVSFASIVSPTNPVIGYIVATYQSIQSGPLIINGPPPGHPDYSAAFNPYLAYSSVLDSLNIFATTTAPDNTATLEIARINLLAGQTQIVSGQLDTTHQVLASVIIPGQTVTLSGDITGPANNSFISKLQGLVVNAGAPQAGQVLTFNGNQWIAQTPSGSTTPIGPASGDLYNNYPGPNVKGLRGIPITTIVPTNGQILQYNSSLNQLVYSNAGSSVNQAGTVALSSDITGIGNAVTRAVLSVNIVLPPGLWRILVSVSTYFNIFNPNADYNPTITSWASDNLGAKFAVGGYGNHVPQNIGINASVSTTGISPLYAGSQTITITSNIFFTGVSGAGTVRSVTAQPPGSAPPPSQFTYLSYVVLPAAA